MRVLSLGGGTQSCALALMSAAGELPKLDGIIFADTHGELPETYAYLDYLRPILAAADIPFQVVSAGSLEQALLADAPTSSNPTPPAHVLNPDGSKGRINRYRCSYDYKRRLIERATKRLVGGRGAWKRPGIVEQWIGFSADEVGRCKPARECSCGHSAQRHESRSCDRCACMTTATPEVLVRRISNAIGIIELRLGDNPIDVMPQATSAELCMILLNAAASLLDHFEVVTP